MAQYPEPVINLAVGQTPNNTAIGTTTAPIVPANARRTGLIVTNGSPTNAVFLSFDADAVEDAGFQLNATATVVFDCMLVSRGALNGIRPANAGADIVLYQEFID
jgi:precorrin isomerase